MIIAFVLTMPNVGSWNGKWTGEGNLYARTVNFGRSKSGKEKAQEILDKKSFYYNFGDGWGANISVKAVNAKEATQIRKKSRGFYGYEWMIDSIKNHLKIQIPER